MRHGLASFELEPPDAAEMARRHAYITALGLPYLVAEIGGCIAASEKAGCRQMIAIIGDSENRPSIRLHEKFGFARAGPLTAVG